MYPYFNPLSRMEKDDLSLHHMLQLWHFNPLSRMEKDYPSILYMHPEIHISIHSLAWRKTILSFLSQGVIKISIHSLAWRKTESILKWINGNVFQSTLSHGERPIFSICTKILYYFNPLSRMEKDSTKSSKCTISSNISIHSLAWRKTVFYVAMTISTAFQSTLSHGERRNVFISQLLLPYFNPLSRMEKDSKNPHKIIYLYLIFA